jgi:hypothetical protein
VTTGAVTPLVPVARGTADIPLGYDAAPTDAARLLTIHIPNKSGILQRSQTSRAKTKLGDDSEASKQATVDPDDTSCWKWFKNLFKPAINQSLRNPNDHPLLKPKEHPRWLRSPRNVKIGTFMPVDADS